MRRIAFLLPLFLFGCSLIQAPVQKTQLVGEAQGTYYSIIYFDEQSRDFQEQIDSILDKFDMSVSLWEPNSILSKINSNDTNVIIDKHFIDNFNISEDVANQTDGAFDFTV